MCAIEQLLDELTMKILLWQVLFTQYNYKNLFDMYELGRATIMVDEISKNSGKKPFDIFWLRPVQPRCFGNVIY